jgi:hypothetical protein
MYENRIMSVHMYVLYIPVYICVFLCVYIYVYIHICRCVYVYMYLERTDATDFWKQNNHCLISSVDGIYTHIYIHINKLDIYTHIQTYVYSIYNYLERTNATDFWKQNNHRFISSVDGARKYSL